MKNLPLLNGSGPASLWLHVWPALLALAMLAIPVRATTVVPPQFSELVGKSDYIVRAAVKSVTSELRDEGPHRHIITQVELEVREVISGKPPQPLVLRMLGGVVGTEEMIVDGTPKFQVGDEDILFVHGNGVQFCPLVALLHGRYPIKSEPATGQRYVIRGDGTPLANEHEVSLPLAESRSVARGLPSAPAALTPEEFVARIKSVVASNASATSTQP